MTNKVMTWVMIIALLISQSYAYAFVPCESNGIVNSQHNEHKVSSNLVPNSLAPMQQTQLVHDMSKHMQHDTQQDTKQNTQQQEMSMQCCDQDCSCLTGTCASVTLTHSITATALNAVSNPSGFYLFILQYTFLPFFLKPPIIS
jgi:hypothetical protein